MNTVDSFLSKLEQDQDLANNFNALVKDQDGEGLIQVLKDNGVAKADWEAYINSMNTVDKFYAKVATDEALAKQVSALTKQKDFAAVLGLMKDNGVTQADIDAVDVKLKNQTENGELSEDMLEEVAGGIAPKGPLVPLMVGGGAIAVGLIAGAAKLIAGGGAEYAAKLSRI